MSTEQRLADDIKTAMRAKEAERLGVLRMVKSRIQEKSVELRGKKGADYKLTEQDVVDVVSAYAKQRRDSIVTYRDAGREEQVAQEERELAILKDYLPEQLDEAAIRAIVQAAVDSTGASGPQGMGLVMKEVMPQVKGKADGKLVNSIVKELIG